MDLPQTSNGLKRYKPFMATGPVKNMQVVEARGRTRLIFDLTRILPYDVRTEGNRVYLALNKVPMAAPVATDAGLDLGEHSAISPSVTDIDFRRGEKGEGVVEIRFSKEGVVADVRKVGDRPYEYKLYQSDNRMSIRVQELKKEQKEKVKKKTSACRWTSRTSKCVRP